MENKLPALGPTGEFPEGRLTEKDEGEITIMIATVKDKIIIEFGTPIVWIGMNRDQATAFGKMLVKKANKIK